MSENITARQKLAIAAFMGGGNTDKAALAASVTPRTILRWMNEPTFRAALDSEQAELARAAGRRLAGLLDDGIDTLSTLLKTANLPPLDRLRVVRAILDSYPRLHELTVTNERLDRIEGMLTDGS